MRRRNPLLRQAFGAVPKDPEVNAARKRNSMLDQRRRNEVEGFLWSWKA